MIRLLRDERWLDDILIKAESGVSVASNYEILEIANLLGSPEHRHEFQIQAIESRRFPRTPSIEARKEVGGNSKKIGDKKSYVETLLVTKLWREASSPLAQARPTLPFPPEEGGGDAGAGADAGLLVGAGLEAGGLVAAGLAGAEDELGRGLQRLESRLLWAMAWWWPS